MKLEEDLLTLIKKEFDKNQIPEVVSHLESITLTHVMAESEHNLRNARFSVVYLADGDLEELVRVTKVAKSDFRDVIYWAGIKKKEQEK
ncbi:hypothetical protein [Aquimarina sp. MMG016]|uniref:hypothetical protein n=1 Tax=Aquimarina sp. MMG016 TaxID=2822690 RepID=UPI001B3A7838|nr:hypothetical protein [Aquimarina sp. MMG016]MBQ4821529.1 hypothetical protein [Aquimarina sp. MMG016]